MNSLDVIVIGGGVVGSAIARELSRYRLRIAVVEKNPDVCNETSGRNSGVVHAGFAYDTGTLKAKFCVEGNRMMDQLAVELDFPFQRCGKILVGNTPEDRESLMQTARQGKANGVENLTLLEHDRLLEVCPWAKGEFALYSPSSGILDPFSYTIALAENAVKNGVSYYLQQEVTAIERYDDAWIVKTRRTTFRARWVINSAGLGCARISEMLGISGYHVIGSKGDYIILDRRTGAKLPMPIYPVPNNLYMGVHVTNTIHGNVIVGPNAETLYDPELFSHYGVSAKSMNDLAQDAGRIWPHIHEGDRIRNYSGILPKWVDEKGNIQDFRIEIRPDLAPRAVNLIGIESPGLTAAVPIARYVAERMQEYDTFVLNDHFNPQRKGITRLADLSEEEQRELILQDPNYGQIICRCEKISRAEILQAIHNPLGVLTVTGIKYRTRAMMGRCQGGYCQMRICEMIEQEMGVKPEEITYSREGSWMFPSKIRNDEG